MKSKKKYFTFYSEDWLGGTADMLPEEKGVYIDLLCYQHLKGVLPNEINRLAKLVGLSIEQFEKIWKKVSTKFIINEYAIENQKMKGILEIKEEKSKKNKIIGIFGYILSQSKAPKEIKQKIQKEFKYTYFMDLDSVRYTERCTEWYTERYRFYMQSKKIKFINENEREIYCIEKAKENLINELGVFIDKYGKDMLNRFFLYWTELNTAKTKCKFQLEKTWETEKRLITWYNNSKNGQKFNRKGGATDREIIESVARTFGEEGN